MWYLIQLSIHYNSSSHSGSHEIEKKNLPTSNYFSPPTINQQVHTTTALQKARHKDVTIGWLNGHGQGEYCKNMTMMEKRGLCPDRLWSKPITPCNSFSHNRTDVTNTKSRESDKENK